MDILLLLLLASRTSRCRTHEAMGDKCVETAETSWVLRGPQDQVYDLLIASTNGIHHPTSGRGPQFCPVRDNSRQRSCYSSVGVRAYRKPGRSGNQHYRYLQSSFCIIAYVEIILLIFVISTRIPRWAIGVRDACK